MSRNDVPAGTLTLMVLRTLDQMGPQHGWGIARRIEQVSGDRLQLNQGTIYPALLQLEQNGWIKRLVGRVGQQPLRPLLRDHAHRETSAGGRRRPLARRIRDDPEVPRSQR